jgi:hypothetical protein
MCKPTLACHSEVRRVYFKTEQIFSSTRLFVPQSDNDLHIKARNEKLLKHIYNLNNLTAKTQIQPLKLQLILRRQ